MQCPFRKSLGKYFVSTVLLNSLVWLCDFEYLVLHTIAQKAALLLHSLNDKSRDLDLSQEISSWLFFSYKLVCLSFIQVSFPFYLLETPICYYILSLLKHSFKGGFLQGNFTFQVLWQLIALLPARLTAGWFTARSSQDIISNGRMGRLLRKRC